MGAAVARLYDFGADYLAGNPIHDTKVDGELNQVIASLNRKVQSKTSAPSSPTDGDTWVDTSIDPPVLKIRDTTNSIWEWVSRILGKGADVASASSIALGDDGGYFDITGTTTINTITAKRAGTIAILQFDGALTVAHNVGNLKLAGAADMTTVAGDHVLLICDGTSWWEVAATAREVSAILTTQGDVLYRNATTVTRLAAGTAGQYLRTGGAGANVSWANPAEGELAAAAVDQATLKTTMSEVSTTSTSAVRLTLPGGEYGFYPQTKISSGLGANVMFIDANEGASHTTYATMISMDQASAGTASAQQRYVTSSGKDLWIFLLAEELTGDIVASYVAPDHPAYGNGGDFEAIPHPFGSVPAGHRVVVLQKDEALSLRELFGIRGLSAKLCEEYQVLLAQELPYVPLHTGRFIDKEPELLGSLPATIHVHAVAALTSGEKVQRRTRMEQGFAQKRARRKVAIDKFKALNFTEEDLKAIGIR